MIDQLRDNDTVVVTRLDLLAPSTLDRLDIAEKLGSAANVRLMDAVNFNNYKAGGQHRYHGGLAKQSPLRLAVPNSGHWHVAVDMQGLRGTVRSSIRIIPA